MRQIIRVSLWTPPSRNVILMDDDKHLSWYVVHIRDPATNTVTKRHYKAVDNLDAYSQAVKQLNEEEERERESKNKAT